MSLVLVCYGWWEYNRNERGRLMNEVAGKICSVSFGVKEFFRFFSTSEFSKLDMVLKTVWFESFESMRGDLEQKLGRGATKEF